MSHETEGRSYGIQKKNLLQVMQRESGKKAADPRRLTEICAAGLGLPGLTGRSAGIARLGSRSDDPQIRGEVMTLIPSFNKAH